MSSEPLQSPPLRSSLHSAGTLHTRVSACYMGRNGGVTVSDRTPEPGDSCRFGPERYQVTHAADCPDWAEGIVTDLRTGKRVPQ